MTNRYKTTGTHTMGDVSSSSTCSPRSVMRNSPLVFRSSIVKRLSGTTGEMSPPVLISTPTRFMEVPYDDDDDNDDNDDEKSVASCPSVMTTVSTNHYNSKNNFSSNDHNKNKNRRGGSDKDRRPTLPTPPPPPTPSSSSSSSKGSKSKSRSSPQSSATMTTVASGGTEGTAAKDYELKRILLSEFIYATSPRPSLSRKSWNARNVGNGVGNVNANANTNTNTNTGNLPPPPPVFSITDLDTFSPRNSLRKSFSQRNSFRAVVIPRQSGILSAGNAGNAGGKDSSLAVEPYRSHLRALRKTFPSTHPLIGKTWNMIGDAYYRGKDYRSALEAYKVAIRCDPGHQRAEGHCNIGKVCHAMNKLDDSIYHLREALAMHEYGAIVTGREYRRYLPVASVHYQLGLAFTMQGSLDKAMRSLNIARTLREVVLGRDHIDVAQTIEAIGKIHVLRNDYNSASRAQMESLSIRTNMHHQRSDRSIGRRGGTSPMPPLPPLPPLPPMALLSTPLPLSKTADAEDADVAAAKGGDGGGGCCRTSDAVLPTCGETSTFAAKRLSDSMKVAVREVKQAIPSDDLIRRMRRREKTFFL